MNKVVPLEALLMLLAFNVSGFFMGSGIARGDETYPFMSQRKIV
jgi:hypothetical protein